MAAMGFVFLYAHNWPVLDELDLGLEIRVGFGEPGEDIAGPA
jgi:hypothetical protein